MPSSRRRFLIAAGVAVLAGCGESNQGQDGRTATPVDVPQSAADVLDMAEQVPVPAVPPATVISDEHRRAVGRNAEDRIETAEATLASTDDVTLADVRDVLNSTAPFQRARREIDRYREMPSRPRFRRVERALGDVASVQGYVRTANGDLDVEAVRTAIASDRDDHANPLADPGYRLASPVMQFLPTVGAAEAAIDRAGDSLDRAERAVAQIEDAAESPQPASIAVAWRGIEGFRLERTNAAGYLDTALDPGSRPRDDALVEAVRTNLDAVSTLDVPRRVDGRLLPAPVRAVLTTVRSRRSSLVAAAGRSDPGKGRRVGLLLSAVDIRNRLEAFADATDATFERPDEEGLPNERLPPAKRRAVDRIDTLAGGAPLQRRIGRSAVAMVKEGDRLRPGQGTDPVASAHFMYVAGRSFAALAMTRGERLADAFGDADGE